MPFCLDPPSPRLRWTGRNPEIGSGQDPQKFKSLICTFLSVRKVPKETGTEKEILF